MNTRLLQLLANAAKVLKVKKGYADSSLKRSATLILNNKNKVSKDVLSLATKFKASLAKSSKTISKSAPIKTVKSVPQSNLDVKESVFKHDKLSILNTFSKFRQRLLIFDFVMGSLRNTWFRNPY